MKKIFISHKFTGLEKSDLHNVIDPIVKKMEDIGYEVFCSLYHENEFNQKGMNIDEIYDYCCQMQKDMDVVLGLIWNNQDSHGMKLELEQAVSDDQDYKLIVDKKISNLQFVSKYQEYASKTIIVDNIHNAVNELDNNIS